MFSSRRRVFGRRAWARLGILGIVSIAIILATSGSPNLSPTWLQPAQFALAQSDTATPTEVPQPEPQPSPTAGLGSPPLTLQSSASVGSAVAGEQFNLTTTIAANSLEPRAIELRATIDGQLELLSIRGGSCSGSGALTCKLSVQRGQSAIIVVAVRVRPNAAPGSQLVYQALAQDDLSNTAASDQIVVMIAQPPPAPTSPPEPAASPTPKQNAPANGAHTSAQPTAMPTSQPARPAPTAPSVAANPVTQSTNAPIALALPTVPAAIMQASVGATTAAAPADDTAPADSWLTLAPDVHAQSSVRPQQAPALVIPAQEQQVAAPPDPPASAPAIYVAVEQRPLVQLPNTATAPPIVVLVTLLLGLALTIHGLRRVRHAAAQLERQSAAMGRLATLGDVAARRRARIGERSLESREE